MITCYWVIFTFFSPFYKNLHKEPVEIRKASCCFSFFCFICVSAIFAVWAKRVMPRKFRFLLVGICPCNMPASFFRFWTDLVLHSNVLMRRFYAALELVLHGKYSCLISLCSTHCILWFRCITCIQHKTCCNTVDFLSQALNKNFTAFYH